MTCKEFFNSLDHLPIFILMVFLPQTLLLFLIWVWVDNYQ